MRSMSGSRLRTSFVAIIIAGNMHHLQMQNVHSQIITVVWQVRSRPCYSMLDAHAEVRLRLDQRQAWVANGRVISRYAHRQLPVVRIGSSLVAHAIIPCVNERQG